MEPLFFFASHFFLSILQGSSRPEQRSSHEKYAWIALWCTHGSVDKRHLGGRLGLFKGTFRLLSAWRHNHVRRWIVDTEIGVLFVISRVGGSLFTRDILSLKHMITEVNICHGSGFLCDLRASVAKSNQRLIAPQDTEYTELIFLLADRETMIGQKQHCIF